MSTFLFPFKIGADPEFNILLLNKKMVAKNIIMKKFNKTENAEQQAKMECDMGLKIENAGILGWDGCTATGELRPKAEHNINKLIENTKKLIKKMNEPECPFSLSTLSFTGSIGGHIHFEVIEPKYKDSKKEQQLLHRLMSSFYLPLMLGENRTNLKLRIKCCYGQISDYRVENVNKTTKTYEFRVPSAEWLTTPKIMRGTIAYLATVYNEILTNPKIRRIAKDLIYKSDEQSKAIQSLALSNFILFSKAIFMEAKKLIKDFQTYPDFKEEIDYILNPQKVLDDKEKANYNILQGWKLTNNKKPNKKELLNKKSIIKKSEDIDLDFLIELIDIPHNKDFQVESLIKELKQRIICLNWNLKNSYSFFGIRKGIEDFIVMNNNNEIIYDGNQIKTILDSDIIELTIKNITEKINKNKKLRTNPSFFFNNNPQKILTVGIPYQIRIENNSNKFIEFIYQLEKRLPNKIDWESRNLIDDCQLTENEKGKIYKLFSKTKTEEENIATNDQATERISRAINDLEYEIREEQKQNNPSQLN